MKIPFPAFEEGMTLVYRVTLRGTGRRTGVRVQHTPIAFLDSDGLSPSGCNACELWDRVTDLSHKDDCVITSLEIDEVHFNEDLVLEDESGEE